MITAEQARQIQEAHVAFVKRQSAKGVDGPVPEGRKEGSDYNLHFSTLESSGADWDAYDAQVREILGLPPLGEEPEDEYDPAAARARVLEFEALRAMVEDVDGEDEIVRALVEAFAEVRRGYPIYDDEAERARYDLRVDAGHVGGGRFRKLSDQMVALLSVWARGEGDNDPLDQFTRDQLAKTVTELRKKALAEGDHASVERLTPRRGASSAELKLALYEDVRAEVNTHRQGSEKPSAKFTMQGPGHRDQDVAVYRDSKGRPVLYRETDAGRRGSRIGGFEDLGELEQWANDNGEPRLAEWAAKERAARTPAKAAKVPVEKAVPVKKTADSHLDMVVEGLRNRRTEVDVIARLDEQRLTPRELDTVGAALGVDTSDAKGVNGKVMRIAFDLARRPDADGPVASMPAPNRETAAAAIARIDGIAEQITRLSLEGDDGTAIRDALSSVPPGDLRKVAKAIGATVPIGMDHDAIRKHIALSLGSYAMADSRGGDGATRTPAKTSPAAAKLAVPGTSGTGPAPVRKLTAREISGMRPDDVAQAARDGRVTPRAAAKHIRERAQGKADSAALIGLGKPDAELAPDRLAERQRSNAEVARLRALADEVEAGPAPVKTVRKAAPKALRQSVLGGGPADENEELLHGLSAAEIASVADELNVVAPVSDSSAGFSMTRRWPGAKDARIRYLLQTLDSARARGGFRSHGRASIPDAVATVVARRRPSPRGAEGMAAIADQVRLAPDAAAAVRILDLDNRLSVAQLRTLANDLGLEVPDRIAKSKNSLTLFVAEKGRTSAAPSSLVSSVPNPEPAPSARAARVIADLSRANPSGPEKLAALRGLQSLNDEELDAVEAHLGLKRQGRVRADRIDWILQKIQADRSPVPNPEGLDTPARPGVSSESSPNPPRPLSAFTAGEMARELADRRNGRPTDPLMAHLSSDDMQTEVDRRIASDPMAAQDVDTVQGWRTNSGDGLDAMPEPQLRSWASEFEVPDAKRRNAAGEYVKTTDQLKAELRAQGVGGPEVEQAKRRAEIDAEQAAAKDTDLAGAFGLSDDPAIREVQVQNRIRQAWQRVVDRQVAAGTRRWRGRDDEHWVKMLDLRAELGDDTPRSDVDRALILVGRDRGSDVISEINQKTLTPADRQAAVYIGEQRKDLVSFHRGGQDLQPLPPVGTAPRLAPAAPSVGATPPSRVVDTPPTTVASLRGRSEAEIVAALDADPTMNPTTLRRLAEDAGITVPKSAKTQAGLRQSIARELSKPVGVDTPPVKATPAKKAAKKAAPRAVAAVDPEGRGPEGLSSDPAVRSAQIENRVRATFRDTKVGGGWASIATLRERMPDVDRAELDRELLRLALEPGVQVIPWDNTKALSAADRAAALRLGGQDNHAFRFEDASPRPLPVVASPAAVKMARGRAAKAAKPVAREEATSTSTLKARSEALERTVAESMPTGEPRKLDGGMAAHTDLITYPDRTVVRKRFTRTRATAAQRSASADRERFGAQVLDAAGGEAPATVRVGDEVFVDFVPGRTQDEVAGFGWANDPVKMAEFRLIADSDQGRLMGLADYLMANTDRNSGNWILGENGRITGFDHESTFKTIKPGQLEAGDFTDFLVHKPDAWGDGVLRDVIDINPADLAVIRARIEALRPAMAEAGRTSWFNAMMRRLADVEKRADPDAPIRL